MFEGLFEVEVAEGVALDAEEEAPEGVVLVGGEGLAPGGEAEGGGRPNLEETAAVERNGAVRGCVMVMFSLECGNRRMRDKLLGYHAGGAVSSAAQDRPSGFPQPPSSRKRVAPSPAKALP